jgi:BMFP domain-containing protein YqiC
MSGLTEPAAQRAAQAPAPVHPVYVYGVIPAADARGWPEVRGLEGPSPVRAVVEGDLAALVSDLPPDHTPGRRDDIEAHQRVLSQAIERGTTIPMRFGMVMDADDMVRERLLAGHSAELGELLSALDGHVQMMVKGFYAENALLADVLAEHPELAEESSALASLPEVEAHAARVQLGERLAKEIEARRAQVESTLANRLADICAEVDVEPASSERVAINAQLLVPRDRRAALDETIRELSEKLAGVIGFRYVGPLPPYSFANLALEDVE